MRPENVEIKIAYVSPETGRYSDSAVDCTGRLQGTILTVDSLRDIPDSTTELYLRNNGFTDLPVGVFDHLANLRRLDLAFNSLTTFQPGVFDKLTKLEEIDLTYNQLNYLPEGIFDALGNLLSLSLYRNKLNNDTKFGTTSFPPADHSSSVFDNLVNLRVLHLGGNLLGELPPGLLDNLTNVEVLGLEYSQVHGLDSDTFRGMSSLKEVNLSENDVRTPFAADLFENCHQLTSVGAAWVWLDSVPFELFRNLPSASAPAPVGMEGPTFVEVPADAADTESAPAGAAEQADGQDPSRTGPPWLVEVHPTVTQIAELANLPDDTKELSLRGLGLKELPAGIFDRFEKLETLDLSANDLRSLPAGIFDRLTQLVRLTVTRTKLTTLPAGVFDRLESLRHLTLTDSRLGQDKLPAGVFDGLSGLEKLYLDNNPLSLKSFESPQTVFGALTSLRVLSMNWLYFPRVPSGWFDNLTSLEELWFFGTHTQEVPAGLLDNMPVVRSVDLSTNELTSLPAGFFDHNPKLEDVWLLENRFAKRSALAGAFTEDVVSRVRAFSTWCNPGWYTTPLSSTPDFHPADPFATQTEVWISSDD